MIAAHFYREDFNICGASPGQNRKKHFCLRFWPGFGIRHAGCTLHVHHHRATPVAGRAEEWLSDYTGDIAAHQAFSAADKVKQRLVEAMARTRAGLSNTLTEEKPIGVSKLAMLHFSDEVSMLRDDIQRFEARLSALDKEH